jgi:hypothetical protein
MKIKRILIKLANWMEAIIREAKIAMGINGFDNSLKWKWYFKICREIYKEGG